jgi:hypothetical protein
MHKANKVILLEFNELCPQLLDRWMGQGLLPNFRKFYSNSDVFTAQADDSEHLEPWIQWYSVHTGLSYQQHGVFNLTDGPTAAHLDIWQMLLRRGLKVASCGSMNVKAFSAPDCLFVPDPWCTSESPFPRPFEIYHKVISQLVQESSTDGRGSLKLFDCGRLLWFLATHGIRLSTIAAGARQVWSDTIRREGTGWRRAMMLDRIQFDLFRRYWLSNLPDFATFFLNSTAHYQHAYWHCLFPEEFGKDPHVPEVRRFQSAILAGYKAMDRLLHECKAFEEQGATLVLATALSQHSNKQSDLLFYRAKDIMAFLRNLLGIVPISIMPVMAEQYVAVFEDAAACERARAQLKRLRASGQQFMYVGEPRENSVFFGCRIREPLSADAIVETGNGATFQFHDYFYALPHTKSGIHHPDSVLWFKTGRHTVHQEKVSILDILPTVLEFFDIDIRHEPEVGNRAGRNVFSGSSIASYR